MENCKFCNKEIVNRNGALKQHEIRCKLNPDKINVKVSGAAVKGVLKGRKPTKGFTGKIPWNKGMKMSSEFKKSISEGMDIVDIVPWNKGKKCPSTSETMKYNGNSGGIRKGSGRGKKGWYKDYWCDSSWELAYVVYNLEHDIKFKRNKEGFEYIFENNTHKYYPDFILEDGSYVEVKGYMDKKNEAKHKYFNGVLNVLEKDEMKPYLEYVINKYGKDFIRLYK